jgi:hypothetical protein
MFAPENVFVEEEPVHQHFIVVAVEGRHLLDVGQLGSEPGEM